MVLHEEKIVIVGAGCFGVSTAYHLLKRGFTNVLVLDRSNTVPARDAASNDINRIVRSSYSDPFYARLGREAILSWKDRGEWSDTYHESGLLNVFSISDEQPGKAYVDGSYRNDIALGARVKDLRGADAIRGVFPKGVLRTADGALANREGYINYDGGWADAGQGLSLMIQKVRELDGKFALGKSVCGIIHENGQSVGVRCADGSSYRASLVIISVGSWTGAVFPNLGLEEQCLATGQCMAMIQLNEEEAALYKDCPVILDLTTGFYIFPPTREHVVKCAIHSFGYTNHVGHSGAISTPRTITSDPIRGLCIPKDALRSLRSNLREVYPDLAQKPFVSTRLCWYNDTPDGDWIIGRYPGDKGLMLATGGSGHAYKFLPVIGRLVADAVEDRLDPELARKFAIGRANGSVDGSRSGAPVELRLDELCTVDDLSLIDV